MPRPLRCYLLLVYVAGLTLVAAQLGLLVRESAVSHSIGASILGQAAVFAVLAVVAGGVVVPLGPGLFQDLSTPLFVGVILLFPPPLPLAIAVPQALAQLGQHRDWPFYQRAFNACHTVLLTGSCSILFTFVASAPDSVRQSHILAATPALCVLVVGYYVLDRVTVLVAIALSGRSWSWTAWWRTAGPHVPSELASGAFGILIAVAWLYQPALLVLFAVPVRMLHTSYLAVARAERRGTQLEAVLTAAQQSRLPQSPAEALRAVVQAARSLGAAASATAYMHTPEDATMLEAVVSDPEPSLPPGPPLRIAEPSAHSSITRAVSAGEHLLVVPLASDECRVEGAILLTGVSASGLGEDALQALEILATHAAMTLRTSHLQARLLARQARLAALQEISSALATISSLEEIAAAAIRKNALFLGASCSAIHLLTDAGTQLVCAATNEDREDLPYADRGPADDALPWAMAARLGRAVWIEPVVDGANHGADDAGQRSAVDLLAVAALPLSVDGRVLGTLTLFYAEPRILSTEDRDYMQAVASLIGQALDRARLYLQEHERAQAAESLARQQADFVASVSHELRTPLTAVMGYAELLEARWQSMRDEVRREHVRRIVRAAHRQLRLVQDLLLVSRLDETALSLECIPTNLAEQVQIAVAEVLGNYRDQQILVTGLADTQVRADPARLVQILVNLLDNAAKYSPEGSMIAVRWMGSAADVVVQVQDTGPGISDHGRQQLFTRFGRLPGSRIREGRVGTGLGLFLGRQLARAMAGDVALEATGPEGSTFSLRLPVVTIGQLESGGDVPV